MPSSWFRNLSSRRPDTRRTPRFRKFLLEVLEDRTLLNAYVVNLAGDAGTASVPGVSGDIRYVIAQANAHPASTITFDTTGTGPTINLTHGELAITADMVIQGPGSGALAINGTT